MKELDLKNKARVATAFCVVFMFGYAVSYCIYSAALPFMKEYYELDLTTTSYFSVFESIGAALAMVLMLTLFDRLDKGRSLAVSAVVFSAALCAIGAAPSFGVMLLIKLFQGAAGGTVDNLVSAYVSDISGEDRAKNLSVLHLFYGVGSVLGPLYATAAVAGGYMWYTSYLGVGLIFAVLTALFIAALKVLKLGSLTAKPKTPSGEKVKIPYLAMIKNRNMVALFAGTFMLMGFNCFITWLPTYLSMYDESVYTAAMRAGVITAYSIGVIASRIIYTAVSGRLRPELYIRVSSLVAAAVGAVALFAGTPWVWYVAMAIIGVTSGSQYTARVVLVCEEFPGYSATAISLNAASGYLAGVVFSTAINSLADHVGYTPAMFIPLAALIFTYAIMRFWYKPHPDTAVKNEQ